MVFLLDSFLLFPHLLSFLSVYYNNNKNNNIQLDIILFAQKLSGEWKKFPVLLLSHAIFYDFFCSVMFYCSSFFKDFCEKIFFFHPISLNPAERDAV